MLKHLRIFNIVLVEQAEIAFEKGLNVLSGETGSGKSAVMGALGLVTGERADSGMIRKGADKGFIEAAFDISALPDVHRVLEQAGLEHFNEEDLIIRREISTNGKSRAFVNNQLAHLALLKQIGNFLLGMSGQHANQRLLSTEHHREILDLFGELLPQCREFTQGWEKENHLRHQIEDHLNNERQRLREIELYRIELEELAQANLKEEEEELLFNEYTLLFNADELTQKITRVIESLHNERYGVLSQFRHIKNHLDHVLTLDSSLQETANLFNESSLQIQEAAYTLQNYLNRIEHSPARLEEVNERLSLINRMKRKYGSSISEVLKYQTEIAGKLQQLENMDNHIETLQIQLKEFENSNIELAKQLTDLRTQSAKTLEKQITELLQSLNMPHAEFYVSVQPQKRTKEGNDLIEFFFAPNLGEHRIPVKDCASGGELSRILLAIQTLLAGKEQIPTLVFDEIDSNIGGATADGVGRNLKEMASLHQIICITHFPQVAKYADHHFQISKQEHEGRTRTFVSLLNKSAKKKELSRMQGLSDQSFTHSK